MFSPRWIVFTPPPRGPAPPSRSHPIHLWILKVARVRVTPCPRPLYLHHGRPPISMRCSIVHFLPLTCLMCQTTICPYLWTWMCSDQLHLQRLMNLTPPS